MILTLKKLLEILRIEPVILEVIVLQFNHCAMEEKRISIS